MRVVKLRDIASSTQTEYSYNVRCQSSSVQCLFYCHHWYFDPSQFLIYFLC